MLFKDVIVSKNVYNEINEPGKPETSNITAWAEGKVQQAGDQHILQALSLSLDAGESEAIALYWEKSAGYSKDFFTKAFFSSEKIILDSSCFQSKRKEWLVKFIVILLLLPDDDEGDNSEARPSKIIKMIKEASDDCYQIFKDSSHALSQLPVPDRPQRKKRTTKKL
jgi:hypothetical protein